MLGLAPRISGLLEPVGRFRTGGGVPFDGVLRWRRQGERGTGRWRWWWRIPARPLRSVEMLLPLPLANLVFPHQWVGGDAYLEVPFPALWPHFDSAFRNLPSNC